MSFFFTSGTAVGLEGIEELDLHLCAGGHAGGNADTERVERVAKVIHFPERRRFLLELRCRCQLAGELLSGRDRAIGLQLETGILLPDHADGGVDAKLGAIVFTNSRLMPTVGETR